MHIPVGLMQRCRKRSGDVHPLMRKLNRMQRRLTIFALWSAALTASATAQAWPGSNWAAPSQDRQQDRAWQGAKSGNILPMSKIRQTLKQRYDGDMRDAFLHERRNGALEYEVIWMTQDNRRLTLIVDAQTGRVVSSR